MGAAGDQYLAGSQTALVGMQRDAVLIQVSVLDPLLDEAHAAGLGGLDQFADDLVGVQKMPRARKEQPALDLLTQLRGDVADGLGLPYIDRYCLLTHARL
ncbi:hypothetical protein D3C87_1955770 [compost metagenome]